jgi:UDP-glucose 4-epimerase
VLGGGFLGTAIAAGLVERGGEVIVVTRSAPAPASLARMSGARVVVADAESFDVIDGLARQVDHIVFALGGSSPAGSADDPVPDHHAPAQLERVLAELKAVRRSRVGFTFISSGGTVYGNGSGPGASMSESAPTRPISFYGITKVECEEIVERYTKHGVIDGRVLRVGNAYGPGQSARSPQGLVAHLFHAAVSGETITLYGASSAVRDYIYIDDVSNAVADLLCVEHAPRILNVGSGIGHSVEEVVRAVEHVTGLPIPTEHLPARRFDVRAVTLDVSQLRALVPFEPRSLVAGLAATWQQMSEERSAQGAVTP